MGLIHELDEATINQIAAGEVIDRPASAVKELLENAIDAQATAVTVEIKDGGISLIRVTDNGCGIAKEDIPTAFLRHATSKIRSITDLLDVSSLGFRGEALSSICAVAQVELITRTPASFGAYRYLIEGSEEKKFEEIGAPEGTTFLVRNLFYNTPARRKFLKSPTTEGNYVQAAVEHIALSHPEVSVRFINNNQTRLHTSGNANLKDLIYQVYGREAASQLLPVSASCDFLAVEGFIGRPVVARGNRNYENYFVNGRFIKNAVITKAIEEAYKGYTMQHKFPFTVLQLTIDHKLLDVNVHPAKMELRLSNQEEIFAFLRDTIAAALGGREHIVQVAPPDAKPVLPAAKPSEAAAVPTAEPPARAAVSQSPPLKKSSEKEPEKHPVSYDAKKATRSQLREEPVSYLEPFETKAKQLRPEKRQTETQMELFETGLLTKEAQARHKIIGQIFDTYWIVEYEKNMFIIDQHAAHEKVLFERTMKRLKQDSIASQSVNPPLIVTLSMQEADVMEQNLKYFEKLGYEISHFGGREYALRAVPDNLYQISRRDLFLEILNDLMEERGKHSPDLVLERIASLSCKAAVKGNMHLSVREAQALIDELLTLENPYHCPHGRPVIISMSQYELEKKFKRVL